MDLLTLPAAAAETLRSRFGLGKEKPRISYFCGPGDVVGTYQCWKEGKQDPRVPTIAYSAMFYELVKQLDLDAQVITTTQVNKIEDSHIQFSGVTRAPWVNRIGYQKSVTTLVRDVTALIDQFDPHIVLLATDFPPTGWRGFATKRKLIISVHNTFWPMGQKPSGIKGSIQISLLSHYARAVDDAICTSEECSRQISTLTGGRLHGLVEIPQVSKRYSIKIRKRARKILYLGRIETEKGIFMLLDAFRNLSNKYNDIHLVFAGTGSKDDELRTCIAASENKNIQFLGQLDAERVHQQIEQADLIVCPTTSGFNEGLATVGLEGAAHGVPTLMSSVVPAHEVLGAGCAVFRADDTEALRQSLDRLISDEAAYAALVEHLKPVRDALYDRSRSWGTQLGRVLLSL